MFDPFSYRIGIVALVALSLSFVPSSVAYIPITITRRSNVLSSRILNSGGRLPHRIIRNHLIFSNNNDDNDKRGKADTTFSSQGSEIESESSGSSESDSFLGKIQKRNVEGSQLRSNYDSFGRLVHINLL